MQGPGRSSAIVASSICHEAILLVSMHPPRSDALLLIVLGAVLVRLAVGLHSYSGGSHVGSAGLLHRARTASSVLVDDWELACVSAAVKAALWNASRSRQAAEVWRL